MIPSIGSAANSYPLSSRHTHGSPNTSATYPADNKKSGTNKEKTGPGELSPEEQRQVAKLRARDQEVRTHEAAHQSAGAGLVRGGASFSYETGPDGKRYAVGGEVSIDTSPVSGDPEATIQKAETIRAAALAPAQPSSQDRAVAAQAAQMAMEARAELAAGSKEEQEGGTNGVDSRSAIHSYHQVGQSGDSGQIIDLFA